MKLSRGFRTAATVVAMAAALASAGQAYTTFSSWGTLNVPFYVNPTNLDVSSSAAISALQAGMNVWNTQSGTAFRFGYAGQTQATTASDDGRNVVLFRNSTSGGLIASTYVWTSAGVIREADIVFWDAARTFFTGSSGCTSGGAYIEDIASHELGHALGLQHSSVADATMNGTYGACSTSFRTLAADDIAGAQALYTDGPGEADTPPTVEILAPSNGATVSAATAVTFSGLATDTTDGDISSRLTWRSNISGQIGTGASFSRTMTAGSHTITATVTDSIGYTTALAIVLTVTSAPTNTAPTVAIASPANGATVTAGTAVTFSGSANDTQDGNLTNRLVWRSNVAGRIGTGGSFTAALTAGTHTITASVTDRGGLTTERGITVNAVAPPATPAPLSVRGYMLQGLQRADLTWSGLTGANVDVYRNGTKITTTPNDGAMTDPINKQGSASYTYKVCAGGTSTCSNEARVSF